MRHVMLHITSGDMAGAGLAASGVPGEVFVWHDILYDGPREPGWPSEEVLDARAQFIESETGGGLSYDLVLRTFVDQYGRLETASGYERVVLWFDACLFDQAMLCHILACMRERSITNVDLLCVDTFPGVEPYNGLGQLDPEQLASVYDRRRPVTPAQMEYATRVDAAFATQDMMALGALSRDADAPLPWVSAAAARWLQEQPDAVTGLGRLQSFVLDALEAGNRTPQSVLSYVAAADGPPRYWGDFMLWVKVNELADRTSPLVHIDGPATRLPQWEGLADLEQFTLTAVPGTEP